MICAHMNLKRSAIKEGMQYFCTDCGTEFILHHVEIIKSNSDVDYPNEDIIHFLPDDE